MFNDKNSGLRLLHLPSVDLSIIAVMFLIVALAWGISKMERSAENTEKFTPVFTVSSELPVTPVIETTTKKEASKVGKFMTLAKTSGKQAAKTTAASKADAIGKIVFSGGAPAGAAVIAPKVLYQAIPDYPAKAVEDGVQGTVMVKVYILKNGRVGEAMVETSSGSQVLDNSALSAVSQWIFEPAVCAKEPTEAWFRIPVRFAIKA